jgi:hypothetical protein
MKMKLIPLATAALLLLTGCKSRVLFMTQTSLGLDVSGTANYPNKVSVSHDRYEVAIIPRKTNGEAHSVFGGLDADMTFFDGHTIKQTFATGEAAKLATGAAYEPPNGTANRGKEALLFYTGTSYGLVLSAGEQQMAPNLLMGYRRTEASIIPVPDPGQEVRSVYADLLINTSDDAGTSAITTNFSTLGGVRIKQSFATGKAAEELARNSVEVREKLQMAAGVRVTEENLEKNRVRAEGIADDVSRRLDRMNDAQINQAIDGLRTVGFETDVSRLEELKRQSLGEKATRLRRALHRPFNSRDDLDRLQRYQELVRGIR